MRYAIAMGGRVVEVEARRLGPDRYAVKIGDGPEQVVDARVAPGLVHLVLGARSLAVSLGARGIGAHAHAAGRDALLEVMDERRRRAAAHDADSAEGVQVVRSPMPGKIVQVLVQAGASVAAGQGLVIVEAMKMENELRATGAGVVTEVLVKAGALVEGNTALVRIEGGRA